MNLREEVELPPPRAGNGIDWLRRIISGEIAGVPIGRALGFCLTEAEPGRVIVTGAPNMQSYNVLGSMHGGWAASIIDTAMALATLSTLDETQAYTTLDIRVNYLRPITMKTGEVRAEGKVLQGGRRIAYCEARLEDAAGKLLVHGTGSCLIFPKEG
jgi:uncharacterized protein (TIGR00369 family)